MLPTMTNGRLICLELKATSKEALFDEMAQMLARDGAVSDQQQFVKDIWAREQLDCTGFEQGVALPHAKSKAVSRPAIAIGVSRQGIEYGAEDGKPTQLIFMIASPDGGANHHIEVLAELSTRLLEPGFIEQMKAATTVEQALTLLKQGPKAEKTGASRQTGGLCSG